MTQQQAAAWHSTHSEDDDPAWVDITRVDAHTYVKYRFFRHSDGCLEIKRSENGKLADKWILDPLPAHKQHVEDAENHIPAMPNRELEQVEKSALAISENELSKQIRSILPKTTTVYAAPQMMNPMQVPNGPQFCLNPHPGTFTWSWGAVNGCQQPQFRVFSDGCQHYQIFNVCAGVWEPQIYWTYCLAH